MGDVVVKTDACTSLLARNKNDRIMLKNNIACFYEGPDNCILGYPGVIPQTTSTPGTIS